MEVGVSVMVGEWVGVEVAVDVQGVRLKFMQGVFVKVIVGASVGVSMGAGDEGLAGLLGPQE